MRTPFRMIAIDFDGTLLDGTGNVSMRSKLAIHRAVQAGLQVCFATGRNWTESKSIIETVSHFSQAVFVSGAIVMDTLREVTLHRTMMHPALAREVCSVLEQLGHCPLVLQDTATSGGVDYLTTAHREINEAERIWREITRTVVHEVASLSDHPHDHTIRVGIVAAPDEVDRAVNGLTRRFGDRIINHCIHVPAYGVDVMEVFDPAVNKWQGLQHIARIYDIQPQQIVAIGDDVNDLPMLKNAGLGVAMGNAKPLAKAAASRVIGRNDEDGLAIFIEQLLDGKI